MRPLRAMFFANDGLGAGHLARTLAIVRALRRKVKGLEVLLATTSEADALLASERVAAVRWPTPATARASGWSDEARRGLAGRVVRAAIEGARPDLLVTDTFPSGPHGELCGLLREIPRRALVRRSVRAERAGDPALSQGLAEYQLAIVPDDPTEHRTERLPMPEVRVPPITLFEAHEAADRETARARLGLPKEGRFVLVCSGGGGDADAVAQAERTAEAIARLPGGAEPVLAVGPLSRRGTLPGLDPHGRPANGVRQVAEVPLQPLLAAFDGAFAPAGYNLSHELAKAGVPTALFAMSRLFDDQAGRAARFEAAGMALALGALDDAALASALEWMKRAPRPSVLAGGAERAAEALIALVAKGAA
jgi:predicted glycosyltransferase